DLGRWTSFSDIKIQRKLQRMRTHAQGRYFLVAFVADPTLDQLLTKDVALEQEVVISLERFQRLVQRTRQRRHVLQLFRREIVDVLLQRVTRIDPVLNAVDTREQHRRKRQVRIA